MIKSNELREGNKVVSMTHNLLNATIQNIMPYSGIVTLREVSTYDTFSNIDPIPLTPEWLGRCGFEDIGSCWFHRGEPSFGLLKDNEGGMYIGNPVRTYVKTVHHLQNLYFALTEGVELQIKTS